MPLFFCVQFTLTDMVIYGALKAADCYGVRWSRVLRPLLLINVTEGRQVSFCVKCNHQVRINLGENDCIVLKNFRWLNNNNNNWCKYERVRNIFLHLLDSREPQWVFINFLRSDQPKMSPRAHQGLSREVIEQAEELKIKHRSHLAHWKSDFMIQQSLLTKMDPFESSKRKYRASRTLELTVTRQKISLAFSEQQSVVVVVVWWCGLEFLPFLNSVFHQKILKEKILHWFMSQSGRMPESCSRTTEVLE